MLKKKLFTQEPSYQESFKSKTKPKMNIYMMKVMQEKQEKD